MQIIKRHLAVFSISTEKKHRLSIADVFHNARSFFLVFLTIFYNKEKN